MAGGPQSIDPRLLAVDPARGQLHASTLFLALWQRHDFAAGLDRVLAKAAAGGMPPPDRA